jgi:hypothetical protein
VLNCNSLGYKKHSDSDVNSCRGDVENVAYKILLKGKLC